MNEWTGKSFKVYEVHAINVKLLSKVQVLLRINIKEFNYEFLWIIPTFNNNKQTKKIENVIHIMNNGNDFSFKHFYRSFFFNGCNVVDFI